MQMPSPEIGGNQACQETWRKANFECEIQAAGRKEKSPFAPSLGAVYPQGGLHLGEVARASLRSSAHVGR